MGKEFQRGFSEGGWCEFTEGDRRGISEGVFRKGGGCGLAGGLQRGDRRRILKKGFLWGF